MGRRKGNPKGSLRDGYYWDGLQSVLTAVTATPLVLRLVEPGAQEFMPATLVRIRGTIALMPTVDTSNTVLMKILEASW